MKKKLFFISDLHGHYQATINSLKEVGYDENNPSHLLVVLGDCMDRGKENIEVFEWLKRLTDEGKAVVTYGNHQSMLIDFLEWNNNPFNYLYNGMNETLADFLHQTMPFETWCLFNKKEFNYSNFAEWAVIARKEINEEYPDLLPWLKSLPRYFESKNCIGTHGAIDMQAKDWHYPEISRNGLRGWDALDWDNGEFIMHKNTTGKTVVVGHFDSGHLRDMWQIDTKDRNDHSILKTEDNTVFIDGCVVLTKKINVYVVEDELL